MKALLAVALLTGMGCASVQSDALPKMAEGLEKTKQLAQSADGLYSLVCKDPGKSALNSVLVSSGVVDAGALGKACADADLGLDAGYAAINGLVEVYTELNNEVAE